MAVKDPSTTFPFESSQAVAVTTWALALTDTANPVRLGVYSDRTVHLTGTFGGATVTLQGSNTGSDYATLNDAQGNALSFTAAGLKGVVELPVFIKPTLTGGDGTTAIVVTLAGRRTE